MSVGTRRRIFNFVGETMVWLIMMSVAFGGLADGYKGVPYGPSSVISTPPLEGCVKNPEESVIWRCDTKVGPTPVLANYMVMEDLYVGTSITVTGFSNATALFNTLLAAWGAGSKTQEYQSGSLPDWLWSAGGVSASWTYNKYSEAGRVTMFHRDLLSKAQALAKEKAKASAGDL